MNDEVEFRPLDDLFVFTENSLWKFSAKGFYTRTRLPEPMSAGTTESIDGSLEYGEEHKYSHLWWRKHNDIEKIRIMPADRDPETHVGLVTGIVKGSNGIWYEVKGHYHVWVDYNDVTLDQTVWGFSKEELEVGQKVTTGDEEGNRCTGKIITVSPYNGPLQDSVGYNYFVNVDLNINTFKAGDIHGV